MSNKQCDEVMVVGAGLNGLMLALTVAEIGCQVHLIGKMLESDSIRTTTINPTAYAHLDQLGVWRQDDISPTPIAHIRVSDEQTKPRNTVADSLIDWHQEESPLAYVFRNKAMVKCLYQLAMRHKNITISSDCTISTYQPRHPTLGDGAAMVSSDDGQDFSAQLIIAADGGGSLLRQAAELKTVTRRPQQTAIVADIVSERPHQNMAWQRFITGGPIALMPIDATQKMSLVWTMKNDDAQALLVAEPHLFNATLTERFGTSLGALTLDSERLSWPLVLRGAIKLHATRMVLAGDAAHTIHPLAGQGYNLGVGDAIALTKLITSALESGQDIGSPHVLRQYSLARLPDITAMTLMTDGLNMGFSFGSKRLASLMGMGMTLIGVSPLKKLAEKFAR